MMFGIWGSSKRSGTALPVKRQITDEERQSLLQAHAVLQARRRECELLEHGLNRLLANLAKKYGVPESSTFDLTTGEIVHGSRV